MSAMKTPGVYIVEGNAFPNSFIEVETAVPAFIGHTEFAIYGTKTLVNIPWRINTLEEFNKYFGNAPKPKFIFDSDDEGKYTIERDDKYSFYYSLKLFFANGGASCYIVSVGNYNDTLTQNAFAVGIEKLEKEQEPTMVVIPEAVLLNDVDECAAIQKQMLKHCADAKNRIAILDIFDGYKNRNNKADDIVTSFREKIGTDNLMYGASYYPWLNTSVVSENEVSFANIDGGFEDFKKMLAIDSPHLKPEIDKIEKNISDSELKVIDALLKGESKPYNAIIMAMEEKLNLLPPSAAMAGIYTLTDTNIGVWKAPANVSPANVVSLATDISHDEQEDLNTPLDGKAINAIRSLIGRGILVWGARTLDGNSQDWRYINVRRTMIMLEESIKNAAKSFVFEPNTANTWIVIKSAISNFLTGVWKRGGLAGAVPDDSFSVHIGLDETMTQEDILEGFMVITVLVAVLRPAEFIDITFRQQMQKS